VISFKFLNFLSQAASIERIQAKIAKTVEHLFILLFEQEIPIAGHISGFFGK
jgi:hypothetical protein